MTCPKCGSAITDLVCAQCRTAWPSPEYLDRAHPLHISAAKRWRNWTLDNRRASQAVRDRELIGG